ncbi:ABC transporter substrate-binding protein [Jannaschia aquimarina]|nr:extracellular solute-binding protein [Jannaschia aquimarina]
MTKVTGLLVGGLLAGSGAAWADAHGCDLGSGNVRILGNDFGAINSVVDRAMECTTSGEMTSNLTTEHKDIQVAALTADPAEYTVAIVANGSLVPLLNEGLVRPLNDLVEQYGQDLSPTQLIRVGDDIVAVAFMANAQHLFYRQDLLEEAGVEPPRTIEDVIAAGQAIREAGIMEHPFVMNSATGWNLGQEFNNMYLGYGGQFFEPGTAQVSINNEVGMQTLETLKALADLSNPDFLTFDSNATSAIWEAGDAALGLLWGSRGTNILDDEGSTEQVTTNTVLAGAPTVGGGDTPATTLWWDGFTIAANASDEDAAASFQAMVHGIDPAILETASEQAVWLVEGYEPTPVAQGVAESAAGGATPYPMLPYMGLLHTALGNELADFMQGKESAEQALADVEAAYTTAATEQGFLR